MDKGWMKAPRSTIEYSQGVKSFIEFAFAQSSSEHNLILCPCKTCRNAYWLGKEEVSDHLVSAGFMHGYTSWIHHGEGIPSSDLGNASSSQCEDGSVSDDELDLMLAEGFGMYDTQVLGEDKVLDEELDGDAEAYHKLVNDGSQQLYPGCQKFSKLQFLVRLLNIKNLWGVSNSCFDDLLSLIKDALPNGAALPKNFHDAKKFVKAIGVAYECIDACKNDCILFRKEYADATFCPVCHASRWKSVKSGVDGRRVHKVPQKVVRHFPLKKRLQRLFMSSKTAPLIRWHDEGRTKDAFLRHPADSPAWKHFDAIHPDFSSEVRNIRLGLATDGFNPFGNMNSSYSIWPIILIPYNVPPWLCMKQTNFILSVIVPGKKSPGKDMDVYMQLTIDDLLECWRDGFVTYDVSRSEKFLLRAALLWTISDWIGRGCLSGESLSACSHCLMDTSSLRLVHGHKTCYMGHRRFLDADHKFRFEASLFDGTEDLREPPIPLSAAEISELTKKIETVFGKLQKNRKKIKKRRHGDEEQDEVDISKVFRKRSCLFQLPYWETLLLRHNIDAMHTEKNVFDNIANTFLDVDRRSKDSLNARLDLKEMGIRPDLHPQDLENNKTYIPPAIYSLGPHEKRVFCEVIQGARFPDGYASNFQNKVRADEKRFVGMNSHDCHIIMHDLLPLAIKNVLPEKVCVPLIKLSNYFKELYSKVICVREMQKLEAEIPETLCLLENIFPPAFFDIMVHLTLHLATEVMLAGPVHYRNMYPIERFLSTLKNLVRTRSHPEGAIAEGFLFTESLAFCSRYLHGCETKFSRSGRHGDIFGPSDPPNQLPYLRKVGRPLSGSCVVELDYTSWIQAQRYVLVNYPDISSYVKYVTPLDGSTVENNSKVASAASSIASIKRASLAQKNSTSVDDAKNQGVLDSKKKKRASNATKQNSTQETRKVAKPMTAPSPHLQKPTATLYT
ncbi:hypothetical protein ACP70R_007534 [Stipagrostis hirtigluma subsp. patula]